MMQKLKQRLSSSDPKMFQQIAHAKINLALQIISRRDDGYHTLNSLVVFTNFGDKVSLEQSSMNSALVTLDVVGSFADELGSSNDNLVLQAAQMLAVELNRLSLSVTPVKITLEKNLPIASGIGGGSADAAATMRLLKGFWDVPENVDIEGLCQALGADVPMCLYSKPLIAQGIGDVITPLQLEDKLHIVLANPSVAVSTPGIFKALNFDTSSKVSERDFAAVLTAGNYDQLGNDLQAVAIRLHPQIEKLLGVMANTKPFHLGMSGSGATCFGLYENEEAAQKALIQIRDKNPHYWAIATTTIAS